MRTVTVHTTGPGQAHAVVDPDPEFVPQGDWEGEPLTGVRIHEIERRGDVELQLVEIAVGGHFVMHASPKLAFCHVVRGAGRVGLPGDQGVGYTGPETFVFHPGALHDWHDVVEDTLLAVAIVPDQQ